MSSEPQIRNHAAFIWSVVADKLRGDYKQSEYGRVILPLVVLRRLDCVLEPTKEQVLDRLAALEGRVENVGPILQAITGIEVYNTSPLTLKRILADPSQVAGNLRAWIAGLRRGDPRRHREVRLRRPDRAARPGEAPVPRPGEGHRGRSPSRRRQQRRDGLPLRGADPPVLRAVERDRRRALHAPRGHPPHGRSPLHRGRRGLRTAGHRADDARPGLRHGRDALGR